MKRFYGTFGCGQAYENQYVVVEAENLTEAREKMFKRFGTKWSCIYPNAEEAGVVRYHLQERVFESHPLTPSVADLSLRVTNVVSTYLESEDFQHTLETLMWEDPLLQKGKELFEGEEYTTWKEIVKSKIASVMAYSTFDIEDTSKAFADQCE